MLLPEGIPCTKVSEREHGVAITRNEILIYATTWRNIEDIMLSERSQTQKATYCVIPLI